jgi:CubicO group peptidase (beta-lactamase class C family)
VDRMHNGWVSTGGDAPFDRYGLAVWAGPGTTWRLDGRYGQYVIIDDERDAVITITAHEETNDHRLAAIAGAALR